MHGQGTMTFKNGDKYVGKLKENVPVGGWFSRSNGKKTWSYMDSNGKWVHKDSRP